MTPLMTPLAAGVNVTPNVQVPGCWPIAAGIDVPQGEEPPETTAKSPLGTMLLSVTTLPE
jgi:hypothetical protein